MDALVDADRRHQGARRRRARPTRELDAARDAPAARRSSTSTSSRPRTRSASTRRRRRRASSASRSTSSARARCRCARCPRRRRVGRPTESSARRTAGVAISEPSTLLTDGLLATVAFVLGVRLWAGVPGDTLARRLWAAAFLVGAAAAAAGGTVHGFRASLPDPLEAALWTGCLMAAALCGALLVAGASCHVLQGAPRRLALVAVALVLIAELGLLFAAPLTRFAVWAGAFWIVSLLALVAGSAGACGATRSDGFGARPRRRGSRRPARRLWASRPLQPQRRGARPDDRRPLALLPCRGAARCSQATGGESEVDSLRRNERGVRGARRSAPLLTKS